MNLRAKARNFFRANQLVDAERAYLKILRSNRTDLETLQLLGTIAYRQNRLTEARKYLNRALSVSPHNHELAYQLGCVHQNTGDLEGACNQFQRAIQLKPDFTEPRIDLGNCKAQQGQQGEARSQYEAVLSINPAHVTARNNLANVLVNQGDIEHALKEWSRVLDLRPGYQSACSNKLLALNYLSNISRQEMYKQHSAWGKGVTSTLQNSQTFSNEPDPHRQIRVAYVSADFRLHSVAYFIEPVLQYYDHGKFRVYCYSAVSRPDPITERLLGYVDGVRLISRECDETVADWVIEDQIDILVDLSGHTDGNRLTLFARKPAPIQFTYLGYPNTSGLQTIDYRVTDSIADPDESDQEFYTEKLVQLPGGFLCYCPPKEFPSITSLPMLAAGHVTFGVFNNVAKITPEIIVVWSRILKDVKGSKLLFKNKAFSDQGTRERYMYLLNDECISSDRIIFSGLTPDKLGYLQSYNNIDIALDTFPYNGTTTTFDALWMGIPVITLPGDRHASRVGATILTRIGMKDLVANTQQEYVDLAVSLARQPGRLQDYRAGARVMLETSPLCDGKRIAREMEEVFRDVWGQWCLSQNQV